MHNEDELLPISGLQHLLFCERQWALIHLEQQWDENKFTAEGRVIHERAHDGGTENRPGVRIARGVRLRCLRLGLVGQADVIEFHRAESGIELPGTLGFWCPFPVEYKRGKPKQNACDEVQLCAQALCIEEMYDTEIRSGALFYGQHRRRTEVRFETTLRDLTASLSARMHELYSAHATPPPIAEPKCDSCSLLARCLPRVLAKPPDVARYLERARAIGED